MFRSSLTNFANLRSCSSDTTNGAQKAERKVKHAQYTHTYTLHIMSFLEEHFRMKWATRSNCSRTPNRMTYIAVMRNGIINTFGVLFYSWSANRNNAQLSDILLRTKYR